ncbi:MAG: hypothetical protein L3J36_09355 [Rhodobacteraceae bacterium]|nr:hypothetical protein [Paracoccaceae bacterium]
MAWYTTGTVDVTNGLAVVSGNGTAWFAGLQVGWVFVGPDGRNYEIISVSDSTTLTLGTNYQGATAAAQFYGAFPTTSLELDLVTSIQALTGSFQSVADGIGQGKMPAAMVFESDPDSGLSLTAPNEVSLRVGNANKLTVSGNVASGDVVQSSTTTPTNGSLNINGMAASFTAMKTTEGVARVKRPAVLDPANSAASASLFLESTGGAAGDESYGSGLTFSKINSGRPGAGIAALQTSADADQLGLSFLVHNSAAASDVLHPAMTLDHVGRLGVGARSPKALVHSQTAGTSDFGVTTYAKNAAFSGESFYAYTDRAASADFNFLLCNSGLGGTADTKFRMRGDGHAFSDLSWNSNGADYSEYFERLHGNPDGEDWRGFSVVLDGDKIRKAKAGEIPFGVVSGNPSVIGDAAPFCWKGKYLRDDFGTHIMEDYEVATWASGGGEYSYAVDAVPDSMTIPKSAIRTTQTRRKLNLDYDPSGVYTPREAGPNGTRLGWSASCACARASRLIPGGSRCAMCRMWSRNGWCVDGGRDQGPVPDANQRCAGDQGTVWRIRHRGGETSYTVGVKAGSRGIRAKVWDCTDDWAALIEIDDNLAQADLNDLDLAVFLAERKTIYERMPPAAKHGGKRGNHHTGGYQNDILSFCQTMSESRGVSRKTIERLVAAGNALLPREIEQLRSAKQAPSLSDLVIIGKCGEAADRAAICTAFFEGTAKSAKEVMDRKKAPGTAVKDPVEGDLKRLNDAFDRASVKAKRRFVRERRGVLQIMMDGDAAEPSEGGDEQ